MQLFQSYTGADKQFVNAVSSLTICAPFPLTMRAAEDVVVCFVGF